MFALLTDLHLLVAGVSVPDHGQVLGNLLVTRVIRLRSPLGQAPA